MDTVFNQQFTLELIRNFPNKIIQAGTAFYLSEDLLWKNEHYTFSIEENDEIEVLFNSEDEDAKLYLEALDILPADSNVYSDEDGKLFRKPSITPFVLYKSNSDYDALRVDIFEIIVKCNGKMYYGSLEVKPKPMDIEEWNIMRKDLENEITGLAQDIVRRNIGLGKYNEGYMPPEKLYNFLVIQKYAKSVLAALMDISDNPRNTIKTQYENVVSTKNHIFDNETVKRYVRMSGSEPTFKVPIKIVNYDIQDNRLLKMIINDYERRLDQFLEWLIEAEKYKNNVSINESSQYNSTWITVVNDFKFEAQKLRKQTAILKNQVWYKSVSSVTNSHIPHSFVLDFRYSLLYQMYMELKKKSFSMELDPKFSYTWKRSSYLYEMWSFIKVCRMLLISYELKDIEWNQIFNEHKLFPFLHPEKCVKFGDDEVSLHVIFDKVLPYKKKNTGTNNPVYIAKSSNISKSHNRPDIIINIYSKKTNWYIGSIILECKYRKLYSFWNENSERSSIEQFQTYYNNARSEYQYGEFGKIFNARPVSEVIVLTPDLLGDNKKKEDFNIIVKAFKPSDDKEMLSSLEKEVNDKIRELLDNAYRLSK